MLFNKYELNELKKVDAEINRTFKITREEITEANRRDYDALGIEIQEHTYNPNKAEYDRQRYQQRKDELKAKRIESKNLLKQPEKWKQSRKDYDRKRYQKLKEIKKGC